MSVIAKAIADRQSEIERLQVEISALAIAMLSLLGAAGERIGYDGWLKANTVKRRTHSLFRQGLMLYHHLPNWPDDRIRPLMETFGEMLLEQRVYRGVFGVI